MEIPTLKSLAARKVGICSTIKWKCYWVREQYCQYCDRHICDGCADEDFCTAMFTVYDGKLICPWNKCTVCDRLHCCAVDKCYKCVNFEAIRGNPLTFSRLCKISKCGKDKLYNIISTDDIKCEARFEEEDEEGNIYMRLYICLREIKDSTHNFTPIHKYYFVSNEHEYWFEKENGYCRGTYSVVSRLRINMNDGSYVYINTKNMFRILTMYHRSAPNMYLADVGAIIKFSV